MTALSPTTTVEFMATGFDPVYAYGPVIDNVSVVAVVPEPGTVLFLGAGLLFFLLRGLKHRPSAANGDPGIKQVPNRAGL